MTNVLIRRNAPNDSCRNLTALMSRCTKTSFIITPHYICAHRNSDNVHNAAFIGYSAVFLVVLRQQDRSDNHTANAGATYDHIPLIFHPQIAVVGAPVGERPLDHVMLTGRAVDETVVEIEVFWLDERGGQAAAIVADPPARYPVQCRERDHVPWLHDTGVRMWRHTSA